MSSSPNPSRDYSTDVLFDFAPVPQWELRCAPGQIVSAKSLASAVHRMNWSSVSLLCAQDGADILANIERLIPDTSVAAIGAYVDGVLSEKASDPVEVVIITVAGDARIVSVTGSAVPEDQRQSPDDSLPVRRVLIALQDVTHRHELRDKIELLSLLPETNPNIVLILQCDNSIVYANPAADQWLSDRNSTNRSDLLDILPQEFLAIPCAQCAELVAKQYSTEWGGRRYDVKVRPLDERARCMVTATDVTDNQRIAQERRIYYQAFQNARSPMVLSDPDGTITHVNREFVELYGVDIPPGSTPRILNPGRDIYRDLGYADGAYDNLFGDLWAAVLDPTIGYWEGTLPNKLADGSIIWVHLIVNAIRDADGHVSALMGMPVDVSEARHREREIRLDIYRAITTLAEARDNETGRHVVRVGRCARQIAEHLGQSTRFCDDIEVFAPLHDIGKVGISDAILLAERKLTETEFTTMKTHTTIGYRILHEKPTLEMAADIVLTHHERWDGTGYPNGLAGEDIPLSGRIVAVSDVYDALRSTRPYKEAWTHHRAKEEIRAGSGSHFDPAVVDAFLAESEVIREIHDNLCDSVNQAAT